MKSFTLTLSVFLCVAGVAFAASEEAEVTVSGQTVVEIAPGILKGYLDEDEMLNSAAFVPPAPDANSGRQTLDKAWADQMRQLRGTPRWDLARRDADLSFPAAVSAFSCTLGFEITEANTPALYLLLWRSLADIGLSSYSAKNAYQRERPFMVNDTPVCTPEDEEALRADGSYPSGHTAIGWGWALILSELVPDHAEALLARGLAFGESRTVCNVHWYSDVVAGRIVGAAAVARLQTNAEFIAAMDDAGTEVAAALAAEPSIDRECAAEAAALKPAP